MHIAPLGDCAMLITVGDTVDRDTQRRVRAIYERLQQAPVPGQLECVPAFASIVVHYDPARAGARLPDTAPYDVVAAAAQSTIDDVGQWPAGAERVVEIPVSYGGEFGPDLEDVARAHGMTPEQVIGEHSCGEYFVYMLGFLPGFPYLGGLSERIATSRRATPRALVPAGSVGIGGSQTGVYSMDSPGGWNIIGRTPLALFSPDRPDPTLLHAGDTVRFRAIDAEEFARLRAERA